MNVHQAAQDSPIPREQHRWNGYEIHTAFSRFQHRPWQVEIRNTHLLCHTLCIASGFSDWVIKETHKPTHSHTHNQPICPNIRTHGQGTKHNAPSVWTWVQILWWTTNSTHSINIRDTVTKLGPLCKVHWAPQYWPDFTSQTISMIYAKVCLRGMLSFPDQDSSGINDILK